MKEKKITWFFFLYISFTLYPEFRKDPVVGPSVKTLQARPETWKFQILNVLFQRDWIKTTTVVSTVTHLCHCTTTCSPFFCFNLNFLYFFYIFEFVYGKDNQLPWSHRDKMYRPESLRRPVGWGHLSSWWSLVLLNTMYTLSHMVSFLSWSRSHSSFPFGVSPLLPYSNLFVVWTHLKHTFFC